MDRRSFLKSSSTSGLFLILSNQWLFEENEPNTANRIVVKEIIYPQVAFPEKRIPLNWKAFPVEKPGPNQKESLILFKTSYNKKIVLPAFLRLTASLDIREKVQIKAFLSQSNREIGIFDIRYAHPFQPFEIKIKKEDVNAIFKEGQGIRLVMTKGNTNVWFFANDNLQSNNIGLQPHLLAGNIIDPEKTLFQNLYSLNSFSPFWMGGCVQDALLELHLQGHVPATETLKLHLGKFLDDTKGVIFENPHTIPVDGSFNSIEDFLPITAIATLYPKHIAIDNALDFISKKKKTDGLIISGKNVTTEGCYTIAYPLVAMAVAKNDHSIAQLAVDQIIFRTKILTDETAIYQKSTLDGDKSFKNWGRGVAWYLLGSIKTYKYIKDNKIENLQGIQNLADSFTQLSMMVLGHQNEEGMWMAYIDRKETGVDTSATAGIAAAIAWGVKSRLLNQNNLSHAKQAYRGLKQYIAADGFIKNATQINRGGEELQALGYRVITQFSMGLMAQLRAALG